MAGLRFTADAFLSSTMALMHALSSSSIVIMDELTLATGEFRKTAGMKDAETRSRSIESSVQRSVYLCKGVTAGRMRRRRNPIDVLVLPVNVRLPATTARPVELRRRAAPRWKSIKRDWNFIVGWNFHGHCLISYSWYSTSRWHWQLWTDESELTKLVISRHFDEKTLRTYYVTLLSDGHLRVSGWVDKIKR